MEDLKIIEKLTLICLIIISIFIFVLIYSFIEMKKDYECVKIYRTGKITTDCKKYFN